MAKRKNDNQLGCPKAVKHEHGVASPSACKTTAIVPAHVVDVEECFNFTPLSVCARDGDTDENCYRFPAVEPAVVVMLSIDAGQFSPQPPKTPECFWWIDDDIPSPRTPPPQQDKTEVPPPKTPTREEQEEDTDEPPETCGNCYKGAAHTACLYCGGKLCIVCDVSLHICPFCNLAKTSLKVSIYLCWFVSDSVFLSSVFSIMLIGLVASLSRERAAGKCTPSRSNSRPSFSLV